MHFCFTEIAHFREKENYKYLEILEADTITQKKMKEKYERSATDERENFSKSDSSAEISSKE